MPSCVQDPEGLQIFSGTGPQDGELFISEHACIFVFLLAPKSGDYYGLALWWGTWGKVYFCESHNYCWKSPIGFRGEGIACSWNVLSVGIFSDSTWCIAAVVLNYIVECARGKKKGKTTVCMLGVFRTVCAFAVWGHSGVFCYIKLKCGLLNKHE